MAVAPTLTTTQFRKDLLADKPDAWTAFITRHRPVLLNIARRVGLKTPLDEDAAQVTLIEFRKSYMAGKFNEDLKVPLRSWLYRIATFKSIHVGQAEWNRPDINGHSFSGIPCDDDPADCWEEEYRKEISRRIRDLLKRRLSERDCNVLLLTLEGWSGKKIGEHLNLSPNNVFVIRNRATLEVAADLEQIDQDF